MKLLVMLGIVATAMSPCAAETQLPELNIPFATSAPKIDGVIDESEWENSALIPELRDTVTGNSVSQKTVCRVLRDADNLYVAYECFDSDIAHLVQTIGEHDNNVWMDDSVELFLDPKGDRKSFFHFIVNPAGVKWEDWGGTLSWDRYWCVKTGKTRDAWQVEMKIPFTSLYIDNTHPAAKKWTANFNRQYLGKGGGRNELSCWSPTGAGFKVPSRFGLLSGIEADDEDYCRRVDASLINPACWRTGNNRVAVKIFNSSMKASEVTISCIDEATDNVLASKKILIKPKFNTVYMNIPIKSAGAQFLQFVVSGEKSRILGSSRVLKVNVASDFTATLLSPCFRNSFQSHDPDKAICVKGFVGALSPGGLRVRGELRLNKDHSPCWQHIVSVANKGDFTLHKRIDLPKPGEYTLFVDLLNRSGSVVASKTYPVNVLAPAPFEVTFDRKHICYINGKPIFPMGIYQVSDQTAKDLNENSARVGLSADLTVDTMLKDAKDHGFNTVIRSMGMASEDYLKKARDLGLYVIPEVGAPSVEAANADYALGSKFDNLLMWYGYDEIDSNRLPYALAAHKNFAQIDPHRPISAAVCDTNMFKNGIQAFDFIMMDPYLIAAGGYPSCNLAAIGDWVDSGLAASDDRMPVWGIPQAFTISGVHFDNLMPTTAQLRCQAYEYIAHGATGLLWYTYYTPEDYSKSPSGRNRWWIVETPLWDYFTKLNAELNEFTQIVIYGDIRGNAEYMINSPHDSMQDISTRVWDYKGSRYLLAVNAWNKSADVTFDGVGRGSVEVLYENRTLKLAYNSLHDHFESYEVHIYKLKL